MSIGSRAEVSRHLWEGYGHVLRILWWLRWAILGLVVTIITLKVIKPCAFVQPFGCADGEG